MSKLKLKENPITAALPEDIPQIAALAMANIKDAGIPVSPCYEKVLMVITQVILDDICFVRRNRAEPKKVDGFLLLSHRVPEYSLDTILYALMFYIKPEFRSFSLARSLLNSAQKYVIIEGTTPLVLDLFNQVDAEKKKKLLTYLGFKEVGSLYVFTPPAKSNERTEETWDHQSVE